MKHIKPYKIFEASKAFPNLHMDVKWVKMSNYQKQILDHICAEASDIGLFIRIYDCYFRPENKALMIQRSITEFKGKTSDLEADKALSGAISNLKENYKRSIVFEIGWGDEHQEHLLSVATGRTEPVGIMNKYGKQINRISKEIEEIMYDSKEVSEVMIFYGNNQSYTLCVID